MSDKIQTQGSESYASKFGAIMSMAGMAIGLGNVWRFPYMVGTYGGGAFVLAYLICMVLIVMPLCILEAGYGKHTGKRLMEAYEEATHKKGISKVIGGICAFVYGSMNFYFIPIMGTCIYFMYACITGRWNVVAPEVIYDEANSKLMLMAVLTAIMVVALGFIVYKGVQSGIEAVSKVMVPLMFIFFIIVIVFALFAIDGMAKGYNFYLKPDFAQWANPSLWVAAMGQALFSIGVGPGCVLIYGSHLGKKEDVTVSMISVCLLDTSIATVAGMAMIPACVAMGLDPQSGSGLIFQVLPALLAQIPAGRFIGLLVFMAIFFAAITSAVAQLEIPVATFMHGCGWSRNKSTVIITIITLIATVPAAISTGYLDFWSNFSGNYGFIVTAGVGAIVYAWVYGVEKVRTETLNPTGIVQLGSWYTIWTKFIATPILVIVMINSLFPFLGGALTETTGAVADTLQGGTIAMIAVLVIVLFGSTIVACKMAMGGNKSAE